MTSEDPRLSLNLSHIHSSLKFELKFDLSINVKIKEELHAG